MSEYHEGDILLIDSDYTFGFCIIEVEEVCEDHIVGNIIDCEIDVDIYDGENIMTRKTWNFERSLPITILERFNEKKVSLKNT